MTREEAVKGLLGRFSEGIDEAMREPEFLAFDLASDVITTARALMMFTCVLSFLEEHGTNEGERMLIKEALRWFYALEPSPQIPRLRLVPPHDPPPP